jgi:hypothetical protein
LLIKLDPQSARIARPGNSQKYKGSQNARSASWETTNRIQDALNALLVKQVRLQVPLALLLALYVKAELL